MEISTEIDEALNLRIHRVSGEIDVGAIKELLGALYRSPDYDDEMSALWDLREARTTTITVDEVRDLANLVKARWSGEGVSRAALVTSRDPDFGMSRMYEMMVASPRNGRIMVFRDIVEASGWLSRK